MLSQLTKVRRKIVPAAPNPFIWFETNPSQHRAQRELKPFDMSLTVIGNSAIKYEAIEIGRVVHSEPPGNDEIAGGIAELRGTFSIGNTQAPPLRNNLSLRLHSSLAVIM